MRTKRRMFPFYILYYALITTVALLIFNANEARHDAFSAQYMQEHGLKVNPVHDPLWMAKYKEYGAINMYTFILFIILALAPVAFRLTKGKPNQSLNTDEFLHR